MKKITALCDYKGVFGSKYFAKPYRSGMDKKVLSEEFAAHGYSCEFGRFSDPELIKLHENTAFIYTSQEDHAYLYKDYIEDVILGLELADNLVVPSYKYLRANNNKVFMETLRKQCLPARYQIKHFAFGCVDELLASLDDLDFPCVVKTSQGAGSKGVRLAMNKEALVRISKQMARTRVFREEWRDRVRAIKHKGYEKESLYRSKFIVQEFIPGLGNDWKVLVYYDRFYVLRRQNRPNDFRASGSGLFTFDDRVDETILEAAREIISCFNVPMISVDLAISSGKPVLIEMQFVFFGTSTLEKSPYYYYHDGSNWKQVHAKSCVEEQYARSVSLFLDDLQR